MLKLGRRKRRYIDRATFFVIAIILSFLVVPQFYFPSIAYASPFKNQSDPLSEFPFLIGSLNASRIKEHILAFSNLESRVTGYDGNQRAALYILDKFKDYGLEPGPATTNGGPSYLHNFTVTVPIDYGASIKILPDGRRLNAYTLWPNLVQTCKTPPGGVRGKIIYAQEGRLDNFEGKVAKDAIILMDFNSGSNWLNAAKLGAKAVIFIAPDKTSRPEAESKFLTVPLNFPRLYVSKEDGEYLRDLAISEGIDVQVEIDMRYETRNAYNVIGIIKGEEAPDEVIVVAAHYDSWSIVPSLSPGADDAAGIATLLELARFYSQHRPRRTIWFVALSGHWEALAGARSFVEDYYFSENVLNGKTKPYIFVGLDFSSDSDRVGIFFAGQFYWFTSNYAQYTGWMTDQIRRRVLPAMEESLGKDYADRVEYILQSGLEFVFTPLPLLLDSEPVALTYSLGITIHTTGGHRFLWNTPLSTFEKVNFENLRPQVEIAACIIHNYVDIERLGVTWQQPQRVYIRGDYGAGFTKLVGQVWTFNISKGWYQPLPNALVRIFSYSNEYKPWAQIIVQADEGGHFEVSGIPAVTAFGGASARLGAGAHMYRVEPFLVNLTSGELEYAPDLGERGKRRFNTDFFMDEAVKNITVVAFRCRTAVLYDVLDPFGLSELITLNPAYLTPLRVKPFSVEVKEFGTHSEPMAYGLLPATSLPLDGVALIFLEETTRFEVIIRLFETRKVALLLVNASTGSPEGEGYYISQESPLAFTALNYTKDLYWLNEGRLRTLRAYNVFGWYIEQMHFKASKSLNDALRLTAEGHYLEGYRETLSAWNWEVNVYGETRNLLEDVINTTAFFFVLLLPFAFIAERLFFATIGGKRRIFLISTTFVVALMPLFFMHPGFHLASNVFAVLLGLIVAFLSLPVLAIIFQNLGQIAKELRERLLGLHFAEIGRGSALLMAFSVGIQNMRRRKFRTILTMISIVLVTLTLVALTSASTFSLMRVTEFTGKAQYTGLKLISGFGEPLSPDLPILLKGLLSQNTIISPRAWYYPPWGGVSLGIAPREMLIGPRGVVWVEGFIGLTDDEYHLMGYDQAEVLTEGRWFEGDFTACILDKRLAEKLGLKSGDMLSWGGYNLTVVGIVDGDMMSTFMDLDQKLPTPFALVELGQIGVGDPFALSLEVRRLDWSEVLIVPFAFAQRILNAPITSVAIKVKEVGEIQSILDKLTLGLQGVDVYVSLETGSNAPIRAYRKALGYLITGGQFIIAPLIIASFTVFNVMLSNVYERVREIGIYASVGLSPLHVAGLFLAETITYAVFSGTLGYLFGITTIQGIINFGMLPQNFYPNFSSTFVIFATIAPMFMCLASSSYPVLKAAKLMTPSLERKWRIPTRPKGREWSIPLPFNIPKGEETGLFHYIEEFLSTHIVEEAGTFLTKGISYEELEEGRVKILTTTIALPPYDSGTLQTASLRAIWDEGSQRFKFEVYLQLIRGEPRVWLTSNQRFVSELRRQFLLWRGLKPSERMRYLARAKGEEKLA